MVFEQVTAGGCLSYLIGCADTAIGALVDPELSHIDRYLALAARNGVRIRYLIDTHTHADHFSATRELARRLEVPVVMFRTSPAPFVDMRVDDGEMLPIGRLRLQVLHTPGHTRDSLCFVVEDRVFTGDTLLIGGTGRTDLPSGDAGALYDSLFERLLLLDPALRVYPAHDYKGRTHSTLGEERRSNPRLQVKSRAEFIALMANLDLGMPTHLTEALRTNMSGGKSVAQLIADATARVPFMALDELAQRITRAGAELTVLDVRERDAFDAGHIPGAVHLPRGQLELRVNEVLPDPTRRIVSCCEFGRISTLATATLRDMGFQRAIALDGGMKAWRAAGHPLVTDR
jgi:glyoxylase-like metal-dependent hydrolase (beta-lactamase superfamily II)/rhodanese-related sulfurtransferase